MTPGELSFYLAACVLHAAWAALPRLRVRATLSATEPLAYLPRQSESRSSQSQTDPRNLILLSKISGIPGYIAIFLCHVIYSKQCMQHLGKFYNLTIR